MRRPIPRRDFLQGSLGLTAVLPLCCSTPEIPAASRRYEDDLLIVDLERADAIGRVGSAGAIVDEARGIDIIVVHVAERRYAALDRSCTHAGAQCAYERRRRTLRCTSLNHAEYSLDGTLLHGRTHGNLRCYPVRRRGARLEILLRGAT